MLLVADKPPGIPAKVTWSEVGYLDRPLSFPKFIETPGLNGL